MFIVQHCQKPGCTVAIRRVVEHQDAPLVCRWHYAGTAYNSERTWPDGMPNPDLPWPWLSDAERERRVRIPMWRERFLSAATKYPNYRAWLTGKVEG